MKQNDSLLQELANARKEIEELHLAEAERKKQEKHQDALRNAAAQRIRICQELEEARREIELMRNGIVANERQNLERRGESGTTNEQTIHDSARRGIDELRYVEGWERQVTLLRTAYRLQEDMTRVLICSRLKGKALSWFHSRPKHMEMSNVTPPPSVNSQKVD